MLAERPLLSKHDILLALDPTGRAGESAFRRLKRDGFITHGIEVKPRRAGRISGTVTAFCALNRDAATAYRKQRPELARRLAARAAKIESSTPAKRVVEIAQQEAPNGAEELDLNALYTRVVRDDRRPADALARSVANARRGLRKPLLDIGIRTIVGTVTSIERDSAEIVSTEDDRYTFPASALPPDGFSVGSPVSVRVELLGEGALWTVVEPAWADLPAGPPDDDPFRDVRPRIPADLAGLIGRARDTRPLTLVGPRLAWR